MKKRIWLILCLIVLMLGIFSVSSGMFNGIFPNDNGIETKFLDVGTSDEYSNDWCDIAINIIRDNAGTTISNNYSDDNFAYHLANMPNTTAKTFNDALDWKSPFTVEFDVINTNNGSNFIQLYDGANEVIKTFNQLGIVNGSHVKIVATDSNVEFIVDNNNTLKVNKTLKSEARIGIGLVKDGNLKYKNFKIY